MTLSTFLLLIQSLPDIIKLLGVLDKAAKEAETDRKVKDDVKKIHEAFSAKDPAMLNHIFNPGVLPVGNQKASNP